MKYDKMVAMKKEQKRKNIKGIKRELDEMVKRKERVSVQKIAEYTGLDRSYFYRNEDVRRLVNDAKQCQDALCDADIIAENKEMKEELMKLRIELIKVKVQNQKLQNELKNLRNQIR